MGIYIVKRIGRGIITFFVAVTLTFLILRLVPSNPVSVMVDSRMTQQDIDALMSDFGLDQPLIVQYGVYLKNLLRGDLGLSFATRQPVVKSLAERLPWTFLLIVSVLCVSLSLGIPMGVAAARRRDTWVDRAVNIFSVVGTSIFVPSLGITILYFFGVKFPLLPIGGTHTPGVHGFAYVIDVLRHIVLPVATVAFGTLAHYVLYIRASMTGIFREDYIRTARSKGMTEGRVVWRHGVRNALIPTVNATGMLLGTLAGGSILTETIFSYPGIGRLIYEAVGKLDYPVLQGAFLTLAAIVIFLSIVTDLLYVKLDPRIKLN